MENELLMLSVRFFLNFLTIFVNLLFYVIFGWVILSWLILFGFVSPDNKLYRFFERALQPVLYPFRWARIGMIDFSPIVALLAFQLLLDLLHQWFLSTF